jgi:hypothetical protein
VIKKPRLELKSAIFFFCVDCAMLDFLKLLSDDLCNERWASDSQIMRF